MPARLSLKIGWIMNSEWWTYVRFTIDINACLLRKILLHDINWIVVSTIRIPAAQRGRGFLLSIGSCVPTPWVRNMKKILGKWWMVELNQVKVGEVCLVWRMVKCPEWSLEVEEWRREERKAEKKLQRTRTRTTAWYMNPNLQFWEGR